MSKQIAKEIALEPLDRCYRAMFRSTQPGGKAQKVSRSEMLHIVAGAGRISGGIKTQHRHRSICEAKLADKTSLGLIGEAVDRIPREISNLRDDFLQHSPAIR